MKAGEDKTLDRAIDLVAFAYLSAVAVGAIFWLKDLAKPLHVPPGKL